MEMQDNNANKGNSYNSCNLFNIVRGNPKDVTGNTRKLIIKIIQIV